MKKEYIIYKLSEEMKNATRIENELFKKFDVKRGLRNEDGTGVLVGLTKIGNVVGYERIPGGGFPANFSIVGMIWKIWHIALLKRSVLDSRKWLICYCPVICLTRKSWLLSVS